MKGGIILSFVKIPNLPDKPATLAVIDGRVKDDIESRLVKAGVCLIKTERHPDVYNAVSFHPDIMLHHLGGKRIVYAPGSNPEMLRKLKNYGFELIEGLTKLNPVYPGNIAYNGARVGNFFFHSLRYTDKIILKELASEGVELIDVRQGYAKCSVAVINENSIITSDKGIAKAAVSRNISTLIIPPQKNIRLPGLDYGFIGGSSGLLNDKQWAVFGNIKKLESFPLIQEFLYQKKCGIISLSDCEIFDYGSLLTLKT